MKILRSFVILFCLGAAAPALQPQAQSTSAGAFFSGDAGKWLFPGEYERHEAMWLLWPTYENKAGFPSTEVVSDMIAALHGHTRVHLAVQDAADEAAAREVLNGRGVPLDHVRFLHIPHGDLWARDIGPQFVRNRAGELRVTDWGFNYWGFEDANSPRSLFDEPFDRDAASVVGVRVLDTRPGPTGVRMVHEGGSTTHNGHGTMVVVESVDMQRNLGPGKFCGGSPLGRISRSPTRTPRIRTGGRARRSSKANTAACSA